MTVHPLPRLSTDVPADDLAADILERQVLNEGTGVADVLLRLGQEFAALDPRKAPPAEVGLLLTTLAATVPSAISSEIAEACARVVGRSDLMECRQPGLDLAMQLLPLLVPTPAATLLPGLAATILGTPDVHPRWAQRAAALLIEVVDW